MCSAIVWISTQSKTLPGRKPKVGRACFLLGLKTLDPCEQFHRRLVVVEQAQTHSDLEAIDQTGLPHSGPFLSRVVGVHPCWRAWCGFSCCPYYGQCCDKSTSECSCHHHLHQYERHHHPHDHHHHHHHHPHHRHPPPHHHPDHPPHHRIILGILVILVILLLIIIVIINIITIITIIIIIVVLLLLIIMILWSAF